MNFMQLPEEYRKPHSLYHILPVSYEGKTTWGKGSSEGANAILKASQHLEYYDEQFKIEPHLEGIYTHEILDLNEKDPEEATKVIREKTTALADQFLLTLGGDHSVTIGAVQGIAKKHACSVLILDAHSDFRYSWNGSQYNHACVSRRLVTDHKIGIVGVRSMDKDEDDQIQANENIKILKAHEYTEERAHEIIDKLNQNVYVSIDVDVFDPSFIRCTGTPEPGGLGWYDVIRILEILFVKKHVIAADIVEFSPIENSDTEAFCLAKLAQKIISLHRRSVDKRILKVQKSMSKQ